MGGGGGGDYRYSIQWQYGRDSAHQDCERRIFLGSFRRMLLREIFEIEVILDPSAYGFGNASLSPIHAQTRLD